MENPQLGGAQVVALAESLITTNLPEEEYLKQLQCLPIPQ